MSNLVTYVDGFSLENPSCIEVVMEGSQTRKLRIANELRVKIR